MPVTCLFKDASFHCWKIHKDLWSLCACFVTLKISTYSNRWSVWDATRTFVQVHPSKVFAHGLGPIDWLATEEMIKTVSMREENGSWVMIILAWVNQSLYNQSFSESWLSLGCCLAFRCVSLLPKWYSISLTFMETVYIQIKAQTFHIWIMYHHSSQVQSKYGN